jgi:hypothetical protein
MAKRKIRLTESQLTRLIERIVAESEKEMEEGWLDDKFKDVKRFTTGYGDEDERSGAEEKFYSDLEEIESEVMANIEDFKYEDESEWEMAKEDLISKAENNNFLGELEILYPRRTGKAAVKYHEGRSRGKEMLQGLGSAAASTTRSYQSRARGH